MADPKTTSSDREKPARKGRHGIPMSLILLLGLGGLVFAAVASVLAIGLWTSQQNTLDLLRDKSQTGVRTLVQEVRELLDPKAAEVQFVAKTIEANPSLLDNPEQLAPIMQATMATQPYALGVAVALTDGRWLRFPRKEKPLIGNWKNFDAVRQSVTGSVSLKTPTWGPPVWNPDLRQALVNVRYPLRIDGQYRGVVFSVVTIGQLSRDLAKARFVGGVPFILYGPNTVLAHPSLIGKRAEGSTATPLPPLAKFGDPVLARIWSPEREASLLSGKKLTIQAFTVQASGKFWLYLYDELKGYGPKPWIVGIHIDTSVTGREINRLFFAAGAGFGILILALVAAFFVSRMIGRPVRSLASAANSVRMLDFGAVGPARGSVVRELDEASNAFNQMIAGLRWFETYLPKTLVLRLMERGGQEEIKSEERVVTVMFTDICGFTAISEQKSASETAQLLNEHFTLINQAVEAEGGTIDKYMGDSVMTFWGAPLTQTDHAIRACRAAVAIGKALEAHNERRRANKDDPIRTRIGLHSGPAIAGNIGSPGRINYTLIGDTVNAANRLEELCKEVDSKSDVCILVSKETADLAGEAFKFEALGQHEIRGREAGMDVYRLLH